MLRTIVIILLSWSSLMAYSQSKPGLRVERMRDIDALLGSWDLKTKMISPGRTIEETGSMTCRSLFDSTYIECESHLRYQNRSRAYKTLITYQADSARYEQIYFYSDSPQRIIETGHFSENELKTTTTFINYKGNAETVSVSLKFTDNNNLFMESRSTATDNEVDYQCTFTRKRT
jgi:hypothetical protein